VTAKENLSNLQT